MRISVHFPAALLADLDDLAQKSGVNRNRLIIEGCEEAVKKRRTWPEAPFHESRFTQRELEELRASSQRFEHGIYEARKSAV